MRRWELRGGSSLPKIQIPIAAAVVMISSSSSRRMGDGGPVRGVFVGSHHSPVDTGGGPMSRSGRVVFVSSLDLHASKPLPVSPLQKEVRWCGSGGSGLSCSIATGSQ